MTTPTEDMPPPPPPMTTPSEEIPPPPPAESLDDRWEEDDVDPPPMPDANPASPAARKQTPERASTPENEAKLWNAYMDDDAMEERQERLKSLEQEHSIRRGVAWCSADPTPEACVLGDGWLRKGELATMIGSAGSGKSVATIQAAMAWALGLPYLGIRPARPLDILLFSGEDDEFAFGQCREGMLENAEAITGRKLTGDDLLALDERLRISFDRRSAGNGFSRMMDSLLRAQAVDLVIVNPMLTYLGGEVVATASQWLRDKILPVLEYRECAGLVVHHTTKLAKGGWDSIDDTYSAIGGAELANIPRAILTLRPTDAENLHVVTSSKRVTTGWKDSEGGVTDRYFVKRTTNHKRPAWLPAERDEVARLIGETSAKSCGKRRNN